MELITKSIDQLKSSDVVIEKKKKKKSKKDKDKDKNKDKDIKVDQDLKPNNIGMDQPQPKKPEFKYIPEEEQTLQLPTKPPLNHHKDSIQAFEYDHEERPEIINEKKLVRERLAMNLDNQINKLDLNLNEDELKHKYDIQSADHQLKVIDDLNKKLYQMNEYNDQQRKEFQANQIKGQMKATYERDSFYIGTRKSSGLNSISEFDERYKHFERRADDIEKAMSPKRQA